ncbi:MAG: chlorophyll synthase ChlG [Halieaceae bacterium]|nr:chlorophyll synthase ChlG [Halieaceae bacterium]
MLPEAMAPTPSTRPELRGMLQLLKPITWFPPMWAFACGAVSSGTNPLDTPLLLLAGIVLAGPMVCGASQVVNDWFDREVDAINEPQRPIPSGRVPGSWGLYLAIIWTALSLILAISLGTTVFWAALLGILLAWAYSAPPLRFKQNGWLGNLAVGISYEGLAWITGAAVMLGTLPGKEVLALAFLYSLGAHGIMTLNDFKALEGDLRMGVRSLPAQLGAERAAKVACLVMAVPQVFVIALLYDWGRPLYAAVVGAVLIAQLFAMRRMLTDPKALAPWYNGTGVTLYVSGMMASAVAIRGLA